jgi:hypothetical protein
MIAYVLITASISVGSSDFGVTLPDLTAYLEALEQRPKSEAQTLRYGELLEAKSDPRGRRVVLEGQVHRRFRLAAEGGFPALVQIWLLDRDKNPWCVVYPQPTADAGTTFDGRRVRFDGTYLTRVAYDSTSGARWAPLVVGPAPPTIATSSWAGPNPTDVGIGVGAAAVVAAVLAMVHMRRPPRRPASVEPDPSFIDGARGKERQGTDA